MSFAKRLVVFLLIILVLGLLSYYYPYLQSLITGKSISNNQEINYQKEPAFVTRVVDGDTIKVEINGSDEEEIIRLLGINNTIV